MIYFRCDGNAALGGGHISRCLAIANALKEKGQECCFILADSEFEDKVKNTGFKSIVLNTKFNDLESEIQQVVSVIKNDGSVLIVDSYYVTERYLEELRRVIKLAYVDDLISFAYPVDFLINYNIYADEDKYLDLYKQKGLIAPIMLLGPKYAPLRKEFADSTKKVINNSIGDVLVSTGASDSLHVSLNLINGIKEKGSRFNYHFVLGEKNNDINAITELAKELSNVRIYHKVSNMSQLMKKCDIAVSAAGSTLYELCCVGTPIITYAMANNQINGIKEFEKQGLVFSLGDIRDKALSLGTIENAIFKLNDPNNRIELSKKIQTIVDGRGASRIALFLIDCDRC